LEYVGYNSRLDEIQAAALRIFLRELTAGRCGAPRGGARYAELGLGELCEIPVDGPATCATSSSAARPSATKCARLPGADRNAEYYLPPLHLQPALDTSATRRARCRNGRAARELLGAALAGIS
jgi:dTDP-4-amino-4,6-dideoxygalactose transaminase